MKNHGGSIRPPSTSVRVKLGGLGGPLLHCTHSLLLYSSASSSPRWRLHEGGSEIVPEADEAAGTLSMEPGQKNIGTCKKKEVKGTQENIGVTL